MLVVLSVCHVQMYILTLQSKKVNKFFQTVIQQNEQMSPKSNALIFSERELLIELHGTQSSQSTNL